MNIYSKKQSQNGHFSQFLDKSDEKIIREKIYLLKLEFYNTHRKMKTIIKRTFISIIRHPNFMHFRPKISFKKSLEIFTSNSEHLRTTSLDYSQVVKHAYTCIYC